MSFNLIKEFSNTKYYQHNSGLELCMIKNDSNKYFFSYLINTQSTNNVGIAHGVEHCILDSTSKMPGADYFNQIKNNSPALFLNATTGSDFMKFYGLTYFYEDLKRLLSFYFNFIFHPVLDKTTFEKECLMEKDGIKTGRIIFNEITSYYSNIAIYAAKEGFQNLFTSSTYAYDAGGNPAEFMNIKYEDLTDFYSRFFVPSNCRLFISGNFDAEELFSLIDELLSTVIIDNSSRRKINNEYNFNDTPRFIKKEVNTPAAFKNMKIISALGKEIKSLEDEILMEFFCRVFFSSSQAVFKSINQDLFGANRIPIPVMDKESRFYTLVFAVRDKFDSAEEYHKSFGEYILSNLKNYDEKKLSEIIDEVYSQLKLELVSNETTLDANCFSYIVNLWTQGIYSDTNLWEKLKYVYAMLKADSKILIRMLTEIILENKNISISDITNTSSQQSLNLTVEKQIFTDIRKNVEIPEYDIKSIPSDIIFPYSIEEYNYGNIDLSFVNVENTDYFNSNIFVELNKDFDFKYSSFLIDYCQNYFYTKFKCRVQIMSQIYKTNSNELVPGLHFSFASEESDAIEIFTGIIEFILGNSEFNFHISQDLIQQKTIKLSQDIYLTGMKMSSAYARSFMNNLSMLYDSGNGISLLNSIKTGNLAERNYSDLSEIFTDRITICIGTSKAKKDSIVRLLEKKKNQSRKIIRTPFETYKNISSSVNYDYAGKLSYPCLVFNTEGITDEKMYASKLIISQYLHNSYLWEKIRKTNGAYETMAFISGYENVFGFASHMDSNPEKSIKVFAEAVNYLETNGISESDIKKSIIRLAPIQLRQYSVSEIIIYIIKNKITSLTLEKQNLLRKCLITADEVSVNDTIKYLGRDFQNGYKIVNLRGIL